MFKGLILSSFLALSASSCALWDIVNPFSNDGLSVDAELTVGDKNQAVNTEVGTSNQQAETIVNNITESANLGWIIFGMLGWLAPSPQELRKMWRNRRGN